MSTRGAPDPLSVPAPPLQEALARAVTAQLLKLACELLRPGLYLVGTPIGHLGDVSLRALSVLSRCDIVLCEDTRHSRKLFSAFGLAPRLEAYHDFSSNADRARVLDHVRAGRAVALISDAGLPLIADPGFKLVRELIKENLSVTVVPGPSASLGALIASGLPTDAFFFAGFLPPKEHGRIERLKELALVPGTLIFYETAPRLAHSLGAIASVFPDREVVIARELTKVHEEFIRGRAWELAGALQERELKGEIVLLVGPNPQEVTPEEEITAALGRALKDKSVREAVGEVAEALGAPKRMVYKLALKLKGDEK